MTNRNMYDLTSADAKIIGFDFQYLYFIKLFLEMKENQSIGFEVKDDIHIDIDTNSSKKLILIQVKHTIRTNKNTATINLTLYDEDLWKSISNWARVICDDKQDRNNISEQKKYLSNTKFILATNKNISSNKFIKMINEYKCGKIKIANIKQYINQLMNQTTNADLKIYFENIINLNIDVLELFFDKIEFIDTGENIIDSIKSSIRNMMIQESRINDIFNNLFAELKKDFFEVVKNKGHQIITFEEKVRKYTPIFEKGRSTALPIRRFSPLFPDNLIEQNFVKELIEIGDISSNDLPEISEYTGFMLNLKLNLDQWRTDGEISKDDIEQFYKNSFYYWKNTHKKNHRSTSYDDNSDNENALKCLDEVRLKELNIHDTQLDINISNGEFYNLANEEKIGWKKSWRDRY